MMRAGDDAESSDEEERRMMRAGDDAERGDEEERRMMPDVSIRPELVELNRDERDCVLEHVAAKGGHCEGCGGTDFDVGHALYLGYLFLDEDNDAYMIALVCRNPDCPAPRTAIKLSEKDFLRGRDQEARAATWRASVPDGVWPTPAANR